MPYLAAAPIDQMPLFIRDGAIVPMGPDIQYVDQKPASPIDLRVYPGADGTFTFAGMLGTRTFRVVWGRQGQKGAPAAPQTVTYKTGTYTGKVLSVHESHRGGYTG